MAKSKSTGKTARRLGRGLSSLVSEPVRVAPEEQDTSQPAADAPDREYHEHARGAAESGGGETSGGSPSHGLRNLPVDSIIPNKNQPRKAFSEESLEALASSIRVSGLLQPVVVRPLPARSADGAPEGAAWELIAGERRWRAARRAGLAVVPAVATRASDRETAEWALVENIQREDLNALERAAGLRRLRDDFGLTQAQVAEQVGLERATVANLIRLTELEPEIAAMLTGGELGAGHGKALLAIPAGPARVSAAKRAAAGGWSVRRLEREAGENQTTNTPAAPAKSAHVRDLEKRLGDALGTKASIKQNANGKSGTISIAYFDLEHFDGLLDRLGASDAAR